MPARLVPRRWRTLTGVLLVAGIVGGIGWTVRGQDWSAAGGLLTSRAVPYLVVAGALNAVALLLAALSWRSVLADLGFPLSRPVAARVYFAGLSAKYVPGRVWVLLTQARLAGDAGVTATATVTGFVVNIVVVLLTGSVVGAVAGPGVLGARGWWLLLPAAALLVLLVRPALVGRLAAVAAGVLRREFALSGTGAGTRAAIGWQLACWVVSGLHLWVLTMALGAPAGRSLLPAVGGFALATTLSTLVVVVPDGAVVREVLLVVALLAVLPLPEAGTTAVASRVVCLVTELATVAVVLAGVAVTRRRGVPGDVDCPAV